MIVIDGTHFGIEKIIELAKPSCIFSPFRWVCNLTTDGSGRARGETKTGPTGQKLSKPIISSMYLPQMPLNLYEQIRETYSWQKSIDLRYPEPSSQ
jgi:hypothetical protein